MNGIQLITKERERQVSEEGWAPEHDDKHTLSELVKAAVCYALPEKYRVFSVKGEGFHIRVAPEWPWKAEWWKPTPNDRIRELTKAGALICAEIDRLQRLTETED